MKSYSDENFPIKIRKDESIYINMHSLSHDVPAGGIYIRGKDRAKFVTTMIAAKEKYIALRKDAIAKGLKDQHVDLGHMGGVKVSGYMQALLRWVYAWRGKLKYNFWIMKRKDGSLKHVMIIKTGKMDLRGAYGKLYNGFIIMFESAEEFDQIIEALDEKKVNEFIEQLPDPKNKDRIYISPEQMR